MARPEINNLTPTPRVKDEELNIACGIRLRTWRNKKGWTMDDMADQITDRGFHIGKESYRNYERGTIPPVRVLQIFNSLGIDLNWYLCGTN